MIKRLAFIAWSSRRRQAFLLLLVLLVVSGISLTAVSLSESMLMSYEETLLTNRSVQARCAADSGVAAVRLFLANNKQTRIESGGLWNNPTYFQAVNVVPDSDPQELCNFSIIAPSLDEQGYFASARYGLQNESARLNLNALVIIDKVMGAASSASAALGSASPSLASLGVPDDLAGSAESAASSGGVGQQLLMGLPGMTEEIADAILDFIDEDDEPRAYGAESEYYSQLQTPYAASNSPLISVDELLLVRGVTPQHLFGLDQNRNGILDSFEQAAMGPIAPTTSTPNTMMDPTTQQTLPLLGWAQYLTLYSREKNVDSDGNPRINLNGADLAQLQTDLSNALGNEEWASYILAYRALGPGDANASTVIPTGGRSNPNTTPPNLPKNPTSIHYRPVNRPEYSLSYDVNRIPTGYLVAMQFKGSTGGGTKSGFGGGPKGQGKAQNQGKGQSPNNGKNQNQGKGPNQEKGPVRDRAPSDQGGQLARPNGVRGGSGGGGGGTGGQGGGVAGVVKAKQENWKSDAVEIDLTAQPKGQFNQILDLIGSTITVNQGNQPVTYKSPFQADPIAMAIYLPILMDKLTTVDGPIIPGRININEAPYEVVAGIPGMTPELVQQLMAARAEENDSENRKFETWPMVEGYVTLEQMRSLLPLITGGGDVYRAQVVGYYEQGAAFARVETVIDAAEALPTVVSYRRLDHLGRGFTNVTLGQRSMGISMAGK